MKINVKEVIDSINKDKECTIKLEAHLVAKISIQTGLYWKSFEKLEAVIVDDFDESHTPLFIGHFPVNTEGVYRACDWITANMVYFKEEVLDYHEDSE